MLYLLYKDRNTKVNRIQRREIEYENGSGIGIIFNDDFIESEFSINEMTLQAVEQCSKTLFDILSVLIETDNIKTLLVSEYIQ